MWTMQFSRHGGQHQGGAALIVALIFLLVMTVIGTTAMRAATMQERMAGNIRDVNLAFQAAEGALREAEDFLLNVAMLPNFNDSNGFYEVNSPVRPDWRADPLAAGGGGFIEYGGTIAGAARPPRYFIEQLSAVTVRPAGTETETGTPLEEIFYFRVTAVGFGGDETTSAVLSTVFRSR